ncbi:MAG TPA: DUF4124 domain-containing protein [Xanthomonadaceae bacterium]|nr:DUF4124 domain-containing protein [Xanthomonadaceae bacterium]
MRPTALLTLGALLALGSAQATDQVYQWKDANGVTHYSATPPAQGKYDVRAVRGADGTPAPKTEAPAEDPACATARSNVALLQGDHKQIQVDSDGDGKPDRMLSDADRANQLELAQAMLKAQCGGAPAAG